MIKQAKTTAIIIYPKVSAQNGRLQKQAQFLIENNVVNSVIILAMLQDDKFAKEVCLGDNITVRRIKTYTYGLPKNVLGYSIKYFEFFLRCIRFCSPIKPSLIIPHSLSVLPIGVWVKKRKNAKLIYDAHELETERSNLKGLQKTISKAMERKLIYHCEKIIVVNEDIAEWYEKTYKLSNVYSMPNIPQNPYVGQLVPRTDLLRKEFNIPAQDIIFIYQGILSQGRGTGELLDIFASGTVSLNRHLVLMGYGDMEADAKLASQKSPNIHFKEAVPLSQIVSYTSSADVGIFFILKDDLCLSYQLSLPNKFFEYTISGLYLCINDKFKVMEKLINENFLGISIKSDKQSMIDFFNSITKEEIEDNFTKSIEYRRCLDWSQNYDKLKRVFIGD